MKICVLIPSHDSVPALFTYDLTQLFAETVAAFPPEAGLELGLAMNIGTYIHRSREELVRQAIADGTDYVLWIDSDMRFPPDALLRLLEHQEPVVGINYASRGMPTDFVALKQVAPDAKTPGEKLVTAPDSTGLEEVEAMGFGLCLIETSGLRRLPKDEPWFWFERRWPGDHIGEDVYFFRLLKEHGLQPLVDHDLSKECGHIGSFAWGVEHAALERGLVS